MDIINLIKIIGRLDSKSIIIIISIFCVTFIILYIISLSTGKPIKIGIGKSSFQFGGNDATTNTIKCNSEYFIKSLLDMKEKLDEKVYKLSSNVIERQLRVARQKLTYFKTILISNYQNLMLSKSDVNNLGKDYRSYQILVGLLIENFEDKFLESFHENHFIELDDNQWGNFLRNKVEYLLNSKTEYLDIMYNDQYIITRHELHLENEKSYNEMRSLIKDIYMEIRDISLSTRKEIDKLIAEFEIDKDDLIKNNWNCPLYRKNI